MNIEDKAQRAQSIVKYAMDIRLAHPERTTADVLAIAEEMHDAAEAFLTEAIVIQSELTVGDIVKCVDNTVADSGYEACLALVMGKEYKVVEKLGSGMILVDHPLTGAIQDPFYPNRFQKVLPEVEGNSTDNQSNNN